MHLRSHTTRKAQAPSGPPQPGSYVGEGASQHKVAFTLKILGDQYGGWYDWDDPPESIPIVVHGVRVDVGAGQPIRLPKIFYDTYRNHVQELRQKNIARQPGDVQGIQRLEGAGAIPRIPTP